MAAHPIDTSFYEARIGDTLIYRMRRILCANLDHLNHHQAGPRVSGILGFDFFANARVTLDFPNKVVYLERYDDRHYLDLAENGRFPRIDSETQSNQGRVHQKKD